MNDKIKETFYARFCGTPEEYALGALEFVCSEADRLEAENAELKTRVPQNGDSLNTKKEEELEKWRDAFGGRTPEEAKRDFDNVIQDLIDCKDGKRKEAIEIVANHISQTGKMVDIRKLVKPLKWEIGNVYNNFCIEDTDFFAKSGDFLFTITHVRNDCSISCETKEIKYFQDSIIVEVKYASCVKLITQIYIENSVQDLNKAKQAAQDWLVSLVANVCGIEVRNDK